MLQQGDLRTLHIIDNLGSQERDEDAAARRFAGAAHHRQLRSLESEDDAVARRSSDAAYHRELRSQQNEAIAAIVRAVDASQYRYAYLTQIFATRERTTGIAHDVQNRPLHAHTLGPMNRLCSGCNALHFACEQSASNKSVYSACCSSGKVNLQLFENFPSVLRGLYTEQDRVSKNSRENIRNSSLAMASMVANIETPPDRGPSRFRVYGQVYHAVGGLRLGIANTPGFRKIRVSDTRKVKSGGKTRKNPDFP